MIELTELNKVIDKKILARGKKYFLDEKIKHVEQVGNKYVAKIEGMQVYTVIIEVVADNLISKSSCNCPFTGPYCQHEAAVYGFLAGIWVEQSAGPSLLVINPFSGRVAEFDQISNEIKLLTSAAKGKKGYITNIKTIQIMDAYGKGLRRAQELLVFKEFELALKIMLHLLRQVVTLATFSHDSNGLIYDFIFQVGAAVRGCAPTVKASSSEANIFFRLIIKEAGIKVYEEIESAKIELMRMATFYLETAAQVEKFDSVLAKMVATGTIYGDDVGELNVDRVLNYEGKQRAIAMLREEMNLGKRGCHKLVHLLIEDGLVDEALVILNDNIGKNCRVDDELFELKYQIHQDLEDFEEAKKAALVLVLENKFTYFLKYKALFSRAEWAVEYVVLKNLIKNHRKGGKGQYIYADILINMGDWEELLAYLGRNLEDVDDYMGYLLPQYLVEVAVLVKRRVFAYASTAKARGQYEKAAKIVYKYALLGDREVALLILGDLACVHVKKYAFMEEIRRFEDEISLM
ncbi:MAG: hypothetical protein ACRC6X_00185 [Culicoidibacterales bacterium]